MINTPGEIIKGIASAAAGLVKVRLFLNVFSTLVPPFPLLHAYCHNFKKHIMQTGTGDTGSQRFHEFQSPRLWAQGSAINERTAFVGCICHNAVQVGPGEDLLAGQIETQALSNQ